MLNKVLIGTIINAILQALRVFVPDLPVSEELAAAITIVVVFIAQFFTRETMESVQKLVLKVPA